MEAGMLVFDTDAVTEKERFSYWVDTLSARFFPFEADRLESASAPFRGRIDARQFGDVMVARHAASRYMLKRTKRSVAQRETGMVILGMPRAVTVVQQFVSYPTMTSTVGEAVIYSGDQFLSVTSPMPTNEDSIFIPRERFRPYLGDVNELAPRVLRPLHQLLPLVLSTADAYLKLDGANAQTIEAATQVLVHLIAVSYGLHPEVDGSVRHSLNQARFNQAISVIAGNSHDPALSASKVARHLGISTRRLHALFESSETSVARQIQTTRLARAREMLTTNADASILDIAMACGFYSNSTFYRCFVEAYGMTPGEHRSRMRDDTGAFLSS